MALQLHDVTFSGPAMPEPFVHHRLEATLVQKQLLRGSDAQSRLETDRSFLLVQQKLRVLGEQGGELRVQRHVLAPLLGYLGYAQLVQAEPVKTREGNEFGGHLLVTSDARARLRAWAAPMGADLDAPGERGRAVRQSPLRIAQRVLLAAKEPIGLLTDGLELRLVLADPSGHDSFLSIALGRSGGWRAALNSPDSFRLLGALCQPRGIASIGELLDEARMAQSAVTDQLREQARRAVEGFLQGLIDAPENRSRRAAWADLGQVSRQLWHEGLILVYRVLFILKLESAADPGRSFAFAATSIWRNSYSPSIALADVVAQVRSRGADTGAFLASSLRALFRLCSEGLSCSEWSLSPLGGALFGSHAMPLLDSLHWSEQAVAELLDALLWTMPKPKTQSQSLGALGREWIDYGTLDVEDLGHIYEALLELEPGVAAERMGRLRRGKLEVVVPMAQADPYLKHGSNVDSVAKPASDAASNDEFDLGGPSKVRFVEEIPAHHFYLRVGLGRKATGSYYTPHAIVRYLVQAILEPQVAARSPTDDPDPWALLSLKILDPAMGSGHFLVEACRYLGDALFEACCLCSELALAAQRQADAVKSDAAREPLLRRAHELWLRLDALPEVSDALLAGASPSNSDRSETALVRQRAAALCRRLVAVHCLYGVDKNPLAVELARVSLWLESYAEGLPLTFVEHRLVQGDSVTGPEFEQLLSFPSTGKPIQGVLYQGVQSRLAECLADGLQQVRFRDASLGRDPADLEAKRAAQIALDQALAPLKLLAAAWSGGVLLGEASNDSAYADLVLSVASGNDARAVVAAHRALAQMVELGRNSVCYALQFPEVFYAEDRTQARTGFDAILGNPPWDAIKFNTKEFLAAFDLRVLEAPTKKQRDRIEEELTRAPDIAALFAQYQTEFEQLKRANDRNYAHQKVTIDGDLAGRQLDLYRVFIERSCQLLGPQGYLGLVVPSSFHTAAGAAGVRKLVAAHHRLIKYVSLINTRRLFDIAPGIEFGLLVARGPNTEAVTPRARFGLEDVEPLASDAALDLLEYPVAELCAGNPYFAFPTTENQVALAALVTCRRSGRTFQELQESLGIDIRSTPTSIHMSHEATHFVPFRDPAASDLDRVVLRYQPEPHDAVLLHEGATFGRYTDTWGDPPRLAMNRDRICSNQRWTTLFHHYKLALRAIVGSSMDKGICTLLPPGCLVSNSALVEATPERRSHAHALALVALLNSSVFNWLLSFYADLNVNLFALKYLPVPNTWPQGFAAHGALRLCANHAGYAPLWQEQLGHEWREPNPKYVWPALPDETTRWILRAAIDAVLAQAYGLDRTQYAYVISRFNHTSCPRTPDYCLAAFDELLALGLERFTKTYDPYWELPIITTLPQPSAIEA